ncbi:MAG: proline iminopeptidase-family hydrolase [Planctomycetota bacterium]
MFFLIAGCQSSQEVPPPSDVVREGTIDTLGGQVWYQIVGADRPGTPLLVLHGGPGIPHDYMKSLSGLSGERPVIFYDQLGCGNSSRREDTTLWTVEHFVRELVQVREALGLDRVHLYGHSWGSMLAVEYLLTKEPEGIESIVLSGPALSAERWIADQHVWLLELPKETQAVVAEAEASGEFETEAYQNAVGEFYAKHVCRMDPWPDDVQGALSPEKMGFDVYATMWGPSEFTAIGTLKDFERVDRLKEIQVPALFLCGRYDEATPAATEYYHRNLPGSEYAVIEDASHLTFAERPQEHHRIVGDFLRRHDSGR